MRRWSLILSFFLLLVAWLAHAGDNLWLECGQVSYVVDPCGAQSDPAMLPPAAPPKLSGETAPLFPRETLAKDTPPLFAQFLNDMTVENLQEYLRWQARRELALRKATMMMRQYGPRLEWKEE